MRGGITPGRRRTSTQGKPLEHDNGALVDGQELPCPWSHKGSFHPRSGMPSSVHRARTGHGPQNMAVLRDLVTPLPPELGHTSIPKTLR